MKIIDIGICVNNIDPKGIGRIRYRPYGMYTSEIERGVEYKEWDEMDPFIALPFLPFHINIIPQIQQGVKLIQYDTSKSTQNVEYLSGPYSSPHDAQNQTFAAQHRDTTYGGVIVKGLKDIRNRDGSFNTPTTRGTIINERDTGFRGNYGSDIIFTENGVQIRGGMLIDKEGKDKKTLLDSPVLSKKMGRLNLKKFPTTFLGTIEEIDTSQVASSLLKYVIEYDINSLSSPTELRLFVYKVMATTGTQFNTNSFGKDTLFSPMDILQVYLINTQLSFTDATYIKQLDGTINSAYIELRELLFQIDNKNLTALDYTYPNEDIHPFYFRPTADFMLQKGIIELENINKSIFLSKVQLRNRTDGYGLIFSRLSANPPVIPSKKTNILGKELKNSGEQSFANLSADKIYLTSTTPNIGPNVKPINFNELDEYELTQDDYIAQIDPNTQPMVRGENLYKYLLAIVELLKDHIHNINEPLVKTDKNWEALMNLTNSLRNDLLNDSIRIN
jgi:hypothetical protein